MSVNYGEWCQMLYGTCVGVLVGEFDQRYWISPGEVETLLIIYEHLLKYYICRRWYAVYILINEGENEIRIYLLLT